MRARPSRMNRLVHDFEFFLRFLVVDLVGAQPSYILAENRPRSCFEPSCPVLRTVWRIHVCGGPALQQHPCEHRSHPHRLRQSEGSRIWATSHVASCIEGVITSTEFVLCLYNMHRNKIRDATISPWKQWDQVVLSVLKKRIKVAETMDWLVARRICWSLS